MAVYEFQDEQALEAFPLVRLQSRAAGQRQDRFPLAQEPVRTGYVQASFDEIDHDALVAQIERRVCDRSMLKLLRGWLRAGVFEGGIVSAIEAGTPQGSPVFGLLPDLPANALAQGANLVRLQHAYARRELTQSALLHLGRGLFAERLEPLVNRAFRSLQSTSTSPLLMLSLDVARSSLAVYRCGRRALYRARAPHPRRATRPRGGRRSAERAPGTGTGGDVAA